MEFVNLHKAFYVLCLVLKRSFFYLITEKYLVSFVHHYPSQFVLLLNFTHLESFDLHWFQQLPKPLRFYLPQNILEICRWCLNTTIRLFIYMIFIRKYFRLISAHCSSRLQSQYPTKRSIFEIKAYLFSAESFHYFHA